MLDLLAAGRKADNGTYYVHRGDLQWWLSYNDDPADEWKSRVRLWVDGDQLLGWSLLSPFAWKAFDVYAAPFLRGTEAEREMLAWAVDQLSAGDYTQTVWVAEDDDFRVRWLTENGFAPREGYMHLLTRPLADPLPAAPLPDGFHARSSRGPTDAERRSIASHAAFESSKSIEEYTARTLRFMQSPVYVNEHELFLVTPQEEVAAFCCIWTDDLNKMGYFEPVGVHPNYQRRGLGKNLLLEGLRRLQSEGMTAASVCAESENPAALGLYESAGFQKIKRLLTFKKENKQ
jgi:ribosomal protein S18 acetylase RimI-like enzyme